LGAELGAALRRRHEERGAVFRLGHTIAAFHGETRVTGARLAGSGVPAEPAVGSEGTVLDADVVVEAVGSVPNTEWLEGNGLDLSDGVLCDNAMRVEGRPRVVAVGDIARFPNPRYDEVPRRVEHWSIP